MPGMSEWKRNIMYRNELALEVAEAKLKLAELQKNVGQHPELSVQITALKALIERQTQVFEGRPSDNSRVARIGAAITPPDSTVVSLQASSQRVVLERAARERQQRQVVRARG